jgi:uncharacterized protein (TIGR03435 family)
MSRSHCEVRLHPPTAALASLFFIAVAPAQVNLTQRFEVVSVRTAAPRNIYIGEMKGGPGTADPGRFTWEYAPLRTILMKAYGLQTFQLIGPGLEDGRFDIAANVPEGTTPDGLNVMLQNLLIDRFGLKFHHESREMAVYELKVARNGPKLKTPPDTDGFPHTPPGTNAANANYRNGVIRLAFGRSRITELAGQLGIEVERMVIDNTALTGVYDLHLEYSRDGLRPLGPPPAVQDPAPNLFTAVQEQLGLKLEPAKEPVDVLVVDNINKVAAAN